MSYASKLSRESINSDLVNREGISVFMFTNDFAYKRLPESTKHYSLRRHIIDAKADKYQQCDYWRKRLYASGSSVLTNLVRAVDYYWENLSDEDFSVVDVGAQYGYFTLILAKYIKTSSHTNNIYAFDCGNAGKLTDYNIKVNQLDDIIKFEYKAISNVSIPHLVYYNSEHSEDNHIVRRNFVNLPSYVVDGITLDDYFKNNNINTKNLVVKIDAQGVEPLVFEGMRKILADKYPPPIVIFEFIPWVCKSIMDPVQFLDSLPKSYMLFDIGKSSNKLKYIKKDDFGMFVNEISAKAPPNTDLLMLHENVAAITSNQKYTPME